MFAIKTFWHFIPPSPTNHTMEFCGNNNDGWSSDLVIDMSFFLTITTKQLNRRSHLCETHRGDPQPDSTKPKSRCLDFNKIFYFDFLFEVENILKVNWEQ